MRILVRGQSYTIPFPFKASAPGQTASITISSFTTGAQLLAKQVNADPASLAFNAMVTVPQSVQAQRVLIVYRTSTSGGVNESSEVALVADSQGSVPGNVATDVNQAITTALGDATLSVILSNPEVLSALATHSDISGASAAILEALAGLSSVVASHSDASAIVAAVKAIPGTDVGKLSTEQTLALVPPLLTSIKTLLGGTLKVQEQSPISGYALETTMSAVKASIIALTSQVADGKDAGTVQSILKEIRAYASQAPATRFTSDSGSGSVQAMQAGAVTWLSPVLTGPGKLYASAQATGAGGYLVLERVADSPILLARSGDPVTLLDVLEAVLTRTYYLHTLRDVPFSGSCRLGFVSGLTALSAIGTVPAVRARWEVVA